MQKSIFAIIFLMIVPLVLVGCGSPSPPSPQSPTETVYVTGAISNGTMYIPCYWKNGSIVNLPGEVSSSTVATCIAVSGSDGYVGGYSFSGTTSKACYWKNGVKIDLLSTNNNAQANSIFISGSDIYVGNVSGGNSYWKNGTEITPTTDDPASTANWRSIYVDGTGLYIVGSDSTGCCYWKNGARVDLSFPSSAFDKYAEQIFVLDSDVYVAGRYNENDSGTGTIKPWKLCYWKNGTLIKDFDPLDTGIAVSMALSIFVSGSDVYVLGVQTSTQKYYYWKNGVRTDLSQSDVSSMYLFNSALYLTGVEDKNNPIPCYWKNGNKVKLSDTAGGTFGILVK